MHAHTPRRHAVRGVSDADRRPVAWALLGIHHGDNEQVLALVQSLECRVEVKHLVFNPLFLLPNALLGATLATLTRASAERLAPPWPDLVIGAGRRTVPAALWIRRQSGGRTRLIRIGRPRAPLARFDLVITTPQYQLPPLPNVVQQALPFQRRDPPAASDLQHWRNVFAELPRPWTGVLVGASAWPLVLHRATARRLAEGVNKYHSRQGGAALVTTSPRTRTEVAHTLRDGLAAPCFFHAWRKDAPNPYRAILALADEFIVTGDSVSMLADACRTGRPVAIFDLPVRRDPLSLAGMAISRAARTEALAGRLLQRATVAGLLSPPRAIRRIHEALCSGLAAVKFDPDTRIRDSRSAVQLDLTSRLALSRARSVVEQVTFFPDSVSGARSLPG